jgi:hypothetical protein
LRRRGLSEATIIKAGLGYQGGERPAITIPLVKDKVCVNVKRRFLDGQEEKYRSLRGRPHLLYPVVPDDEMLIVCEGEFDALLCRQEGIPAITGTAGFRTWLPEWSSKVWRNSLGARQVAFVYDPAGPSAGEQTPYERALELAEHMRTLGADAWAVDLSLAGFAPGEDLTDWFVAYGWTATDLIEFIEDQRSDA